MAKGKARQILCIRCRRRLPATHYRRSGYQFCGHICLDCRETQEAIDQLSWWETSLLYRPPIAERDLLERRA